ncbi:MAG: hypothetical protein IKU72_02000 [Oscillospiraceae bacterium]|nr:hypothetical protein [Oscillospiraceae bacterium]
MEHWMTAALLAAALTLGAYRLGLRDGLWQAGRTLPGIGGRKKPDRRQEKTLAARVEEF